MRHRAPVGAAAVLALATALVGCDTVPVDTDPSIHPLSRRSLIPSSSGAETQRPSGGSGEAPNPYSASDATPKQSITAPATWRAAVGGSRSVLRPMRSSGENSRAAGTRKAYRMAIHKGRDSHHSLLPGISPRPMPPMP